MVFIKIFNFEPKSQLIFLNNGVKDVAMYWSGTQFDGHLVVFITVPPDGCIEAIESATYITGCIEPSLRDVRVSKTQEYSR